MHPRRPPCSTVWRRSRFCTCCTRTAPWRAPLTSCFARCWRPLSRSSSASRWLRTMCDAAWRAARAPPNTCCRSLGRQGWPCRALPLPLHALPAVYSLHLVCLPTRPPLPGRSAGAGHDPAVAACRQPRCAAVPASGAGVVAAAGCKVRLGAGELRDKQAQGLPGSATDVCAAISTPSHSHNCLAGCCAGATPALPTWRPWQRSSCSPSTMCCLGRRWPPLTTCSATPTALPAGLEQQAARETQQGMLHVKPWNVSCWQWCAALTTACASPF